MADTKISALTAASSVAAADTIPIVQGGANKRATFSQIPGDGVDWSTLLSILHGGTGASTAAGARAALVAAGSGANSDITSITGLLTPLSIAQGGTGAATVAAATAILNAVVGDTGSGGTKGLVPAPAAGDAAAAKFLKADGTWAVPSSTGGLTQAQASKIASFRA